jgi:putative nucleotidyltransferase with HDIG domain
VASQKEEIKQSRRRRLNWIVVVLMVVAITVFSLPTFDYFRTADLEPGKPSPRTYQVEERYRIRDVDKTNQRRREARRKIVPQFIFVEPVTDNVLRNIDSLMKSVRSDSEAIPTDLTSPLNEPEWKQTARIADIIARFLLTQGIIQDYSAFETLKYQDNAQLVLKHSKPENQPTFQRRTLPLNTLHNRFVSLERIEVQVRQTLSDLYPDYSYPDFLVWMLKNTLKPNVSFNRSEFRRQVEQIRQKIEPFYLTFQPGDVILEAGQTVRDDHIQILNQLSQKRLHLQLTMGGASFGIAVIAVICLYFYLREFEPELFAEHNKLALMAVLSVMFVGLAKVVDLLQTNLPPSIEFALPLAAPVMLVTLMVSEGVAFLFTIFIALIMTSYFSLQIELFIMLLLGGLTGIFTIRKVERRITLLQSGLLIGLVQVVMVVCLMTLNTGEAFLTATGTHILWAAINGVIIVPFTVLGLLPFLENGFGITTNFRLLELADLNHPLLQELFQQAPGSFQHSVMLSNLCEQTAREIDANALLVRVGCLYHDLGKAENPEYFIENQQGNKNPHDELKPTLSASILKAHVKKGSQTAREAGLPDEIIDLIEQHHGTTVMKPFYHEALKENEDEVNKEEFQYPGPLPQTREAGLCMLGDAVEAACRALEDPTPQKIKERISKIVRDKFSEGQLNECDLTLRDLNTIIDNFTRVLTSVYHRRIEYPEAENPEEMDQKVQNMQSGATEET